MGARETCTDTCLWPATSCFSSQSLGEAENQLVSAGASYPLTINRTGFCTLQCQGDTECQPGYACFRELRTAQAATTAIGNCLASAAAPRSQISSLLGTLCNSTITFPEETNGCVTLNSAGILWSWKGGVSAGVEITLIVPQAQLQQVQFPEPLGAQFAVNPYRPFGVGISFHRPGEVERVRSREFDDFAKPGLLTKIAVTKRSTTFDFSDPGRDKEVRWAPLHREILLPNVRGVTADVNGYPVAQSIYLEIFPLEISEIEVSETVRYTLLNWFGDSTAVAGFLTGFGFWAGFSFVVLVKPVV